MGYGADTTQVGVLASTGTGLAVAGQFVAAAVLVLAGMALYTIVKVRKHRRAQ